MNLSSITPFGYHYSSGDPSHTASYVWPAVRTILEQELADTLDQRVFELGCGNGAFGAHLARLGYRVSGVDPSREGIAIANTSYPELDLHVGSSDDDLPSRFGQFPVVVSLEVVEHVYAPRKFAVCLHELLQEGGLAVVSTPYHGYWKNLALAISGKMDRHFTALWDGGHIKFWSIATLTELLREAGFREISFRRVGRLGPLAKSMIAIARK